MFDGRATATSHGYIGEEYTRDVDRHVPGLVVLDAFLSEAEAEAMQAELDSRPYSDELRRRTQQYVYQFHFRNRRRNVLKRLDEAPFDALPASCKEPLRRLREAGVISADECETAFDQLIVNDYGSTHGIRPHLDRTDCFREHVVGFSLGSPVVMDFRCLETGQVRAVLLQPRSVLVLAGDARYKWQHSIVNINPHMWRGDKFKRERRTSLTFRKVDMAWLASRNPEQLPRVRVPGATAAALVVLSVAVAAVAAWLQRKRVQGAS